MKLHDKIALKAKHFAGDEPCPISAALKEKGYRDVVVGRFNLIIDKEKISIMRPEFGYLKDNLSQDLIKARQSHPEQIVSVVGFDQYLKPKKNRYEI
jgi:hypothetical protein